MSTNFSYIIGRDYINIVINGNPYQFEREDPNTAFIIKCIEDNDIDKILEYANGNGIREYISEDLYNEDGIIIKNDTVYIDEEPIPSSLADEIIRHYNEGVPFKYLVMFIRKVRLNPSYRIREQLWKFIAASAESGGFTIDTEGNIIAYKRVRSDFTDCHTGKFDNSVGSVVKMDRYDVDDNPDRTCSAGLHFCAFSYLNHYGDFSSAYKVVLVKVDPKNVVSIPNDYGFAKARCCEYEVIAEYFEHEAIEEPVYNNKQCSDSNEITGITFDDVAKYVDAVTLNEVRQLYICIMGSGPKKFESKAVAKGRLFKAIQGITDYKIYNTVETVIKA